ncbi:hypothetical protein Tco_1174335 [Tanacetum coccineum]
MLGSLQKDDDDEISNLVDLHMGMHRWRIQYLQSCRFAYGYAWWWMEMARSSKLALVDHHKSCGYGGGSGKIHDDSSCKKDSVDDSILIEVKSFQKDEDDDEIFQSCRSNLVDLHIYMLYDGWRWQVLQGLLWYVRVNTLHFNRAAPDEYYVKAYHNDRSECNGYNLDGLRYRQRRTLVTLTSMEESPILPSEFLKHIVNNQVGNRLVLTNLLNNTVSIMPFADSGLGLRVERVPRMPLNALVPFIRSPIDKDKRMAHECVWDNHEEHHVNEDN